MAENELEIVLKLDDQATPEAKKRLQEVGNAGKAASDKTVSGFREAGKAVHDFHKEMYAGVVVFGLVATALTEWGKRNNMVRDSMQEIGLASSNAAAKAGKFIQEHSVWGVAFLAAAIGAKKMNDSINDTYTQVQRATNEVKNFNDEQTKQKTLFIDGKMSAEQYYDSIYKAQQANISINIQAGQQLQQLAQVTADVHNKDLLDAQAKTTEQINLLNYYKQNHATAMQGVASLTMTLGKTISANMSQAFTSMITGAKSAKEAFADLGKAMIGAIVDFMVQKVIAWVLEKTLLAGTVAASSTAAVAIAAAWAPAAALVSAATFGASAVAGGAALTATAALSAGIAASSGASRAINVSSQASAGGNVIGANGVFARARGGDDIVTKPTLFLAGEAGPERATFTPLNGGGDIGSGGGGIQVNVYGGNFNSRDMVRELAESIGFEIERKLRGVRSFA